MQDHVIETVIFKTEDGIERDTFMETLKASSQFVKDQPGFVSRRLSYTDDDTWIEHIEWKTRAHAQAAASEIGKDARTQAFISKISGPSVVMYHSALIISLDA